MANRIRLSLFRSNRSGSAYSPFSNDDVDEEEGIEGVSDDEGNDKTTQGTNGGGLNIQDTPPPEDNVKEDERTLYRFGPFAPRCLQFMNNMPFFMVWTVILIITWSFSSIAPSVPHVEKQFGLTSKMAALLGSCQDIAGLSVMLFVSYIGTKLNMAHGLAVGAFLYGIGSLFICIPHYIERAVIKEISENKKNATSLDICPLQPIIDISNSSASSGDTTTDTHYTNFAILVVGELLRGVGTTPLFTLGTAYIDENGVYPSTAIYIGISYAASALGAAINGLSSGYILDHLYVDFDKASPESIPTDAKDPNWIGAWWLPFQISAAVCIFVSIPLYGYPKHLPGIKASKTVSDEEADSNDVVEDVAKKTMSEMMKTAIREFIKAAKKLLTNAEFLVLSIATAMTTCAAIGIGMFSFKYLTEMYDLSFQVAGYIMSAKAILTGASFILGGAIIRHFKLHALGIERLSFALSVLSALLALGILARCPNVKISGIEVPYFGQNETSGLISECQGQCHCQGHSFNPVCGADDNVYYSPCHAGCQEKEINGTETIYTNCSCINTISSSSGLEHDHTAKQGRCELGCYGVYVSTPLTFIMTLFAVMSISNESIATLRCVDQDLRPFALGLQWMVMRLLGNIPSPVFLGAILDDVCLLWSDPVEGEGSRYCQLYDKEKLSYGFSFLWLTGSSISGFLFLLASYFNMRKTRNKQILDDKNTEEGIS